MRQITRAIWRVGTTALFVRLGGTWRIRITAGGYEYYGVYFLSNKNATKVAL